MVLRRTHAGIKYWRIDDTADDSRIQIYIIGNPVIMTTVALAVAAFVAFGLYAIRNSSASKLSPRLKHLFLSGWYAQSLTGLPRACHC
jgi:hypothetical protein